MDNALSAITKNAARVVIIDNHRAFRWWTHVANSLVKRCKAAKLLGVDCMLVGISAEVARSLVLLGIDLSFVQTFSTLEASLTEALAKQDYGSLHAHTAQHASSLPKTLSTTPRTAHSTPRSSRR